MNITVTFDSYNHSLPGGSILSRLFNQIDKVETVYKPYLVGNLVGARLISCTGSDPDGLTVDLLPVIKITNQELDLEEWCEKHYLSLPQELQTAQPL